jgi:hypothetical protein
MSLVDNTIEFVGGFELDFNDFIEVFLTVDFFPDTKSFFYSSVDSFWA